jgi:hypothetical protein
MTTQFRLKVISCDVFRREVYALASRSPNLIDLEFLPKGLHDIGADLMRAGLQEVIDRAGEGYDAIVLAYGLCNNGLVGVTARSMPLVLPRSHDCIGIFLGSRHRYKEYFYANPGAYFETTGWIERGVAGQEFLQVSIPHMNGMDSKYQELVEKYGEDNAKYIYETLCDQTKNYRKLKFIEMGIEPNDSWETTSRNKAVDKGWDFEKISGDIGILQRLIDGDWCRSDFLVIPPGGKIRARYDDNIVETDQQHEQT